MRLHEFSAIFAALLCIFIVQVNSLMWELEPNSHKCLKEKLPGNVAVAGECMVSIAPGQRVDYVIKDSKGHILQQTDDMQHGKNSKIRFSTGSYDTYEICFVSHVPPNQRGIKQEVFLSLKSGVEAKSYSGMAEAAKLKPIEVELKRLEDLSIEIVEGFAIMRQNEVEFRDTNEATNSRVFYFSIFSLCCVVSLSVWQAIYLRTYFKAKKLIE